MKKIISGLLLLSMMNVSAVMAQDTTVVETASKKENIVKINLSSLVFKNISVQYERVITKRMSLGLGVSFLPKSGLPFAGSLKEQFGENEDARRAIESTQLGSFAVTPEVRFYIGKKGAPTGFYIAPFARYQNMSFEQEYEFTASNNKVYRPLVKGSINNIGGGILLGTQWNLGKNISLDWWIAGPLFGSSNGNLTGTGDLSDLTAQDRAELENDIESVDLPLTKVDATVGNNRIDVKLSGPYAGVRAFGFALGFRF